MFSVNYRIMFCDADPAGVLFFGNIFRIVHYALENYLQSGNLYSEYFGNPELAFPIIKTSADFKKPLKPGDEIKITLNVLQLRESSFEIEYFFYNKEEIAVSAGTVHVCIDKISGKKKFLPDGISNFLKNK
jgi:1,4-dihydroxy-2-naphthoyl-CoA hydrolase